MPVVDQPSVEGPVADPSPPAEPLNLKSALQQVASFASYPRKDRDLFYWSDRHSFNLRTWFIPRSVMEIFRKAEVDKVISVINWEYIISEKNTLEYSSTSPKTLLRNYILALKHLWDARKTPEFKELLSEHTGAANYRFLDINSSFDVVLDRLIRENLPEDARYAGRSVQSSNSDLSEHGESSEHREASERSEASFSGFDEFPVVLALMIDKLHIVAAKPHLSFVRAAAFVSMYQRTDGVLQTLIADDVGPAQPSITNVSPAELFTVDHWFTSLMMTKEHPTFTLKQGFDHGMRSWLRDLSKSWRTYATTKLGLKKDIMRLFAEYGRVSTLYALSQSWNGFRPIIVDADSQTIRKAYQPDTEVSGLMLPRVIQTTVLDRLNEKALMRDALKWFRESLAPKEIVVVTPPGSKRTAVPEPTMAFLPGVERDSARSTKRIRVASERGLLAASSGLNIANILKHTG
ncbi:hypothetical protein CAUPRSCDRAFT_12358 [Caulochytrium protostelioides]|uniref:Uncharacterized protein n=1 Tax=Caulochytrium protostelioides TaxID=1555241 RepID=A0A4P9WRT7_9FUNG|nr:hypothetical protein CAUPRSCDRAFT_12358 [Caulochytrium protostelioides]